MHYSEFLDLLTLIFFFVSHPQYPSQFKENRKYVVSQIMEEIASWVISLEKILPLENMVSCLSILFGNLKLNEF